MNYRLNPSDLTFFYEDCKRCFYLKVVKNLPQPSIPLPSIFSQIANLLKNYYDGKHTSELHIALPPGIVSHSEQNVKSKVIKLPNHEATCFVSGRFDIVVSFEDRTYGVIDFKTGNPNSKSAHLYSRQLYAYAYALENPAINALSLSPITKMGLLYFYPSSIKQQTIEKLSFESEITWIEIEKDQQRFLKFIDDVLNVLELPEAPEHSPTCQWGSYFDKLNKLF